DITGDGQPDDDSVLEAAGITGEERSHLAGRYPAGQQLWRWPMTHLSPWDCNWPYGPPDDAEGPPPPPAPDPPVNDPCQVTDRSTIDVQNQVLAEQIPITGTGLQLTYASDRVLGRVAARTLELPLTGDTVPASLKRVEWEVTVAGQVHRGQAAAEPSQQHVFVWDGRDAYGRQVQGAQRINARIDYVYPA